ncbi:MAG TPA: D-glycero-beta-D-manno-heptose-7-phosphate kinase [Candidatus Limnocylindria bacterium]|jgi:D-beta-D-heptose 7-phosphate kinase/D-beta-D-heptose 1-phosphate adenosyltransferase|nr:D-glycero-beta-D-manno-heptose-7-phosphate kinase [Candidatus Limnocylindria bacterium]
MTTLSLERVDELLDGARRAKILTVGDLMLDHFLYGRVTRISPEAPVPVVEFQRETFMPGGAANVARNITALGGQTVLFGAVGRDAAADQLRELLTVDRVKCSGLLEIPTRQTTNKMRVVAGQQQITRVDRETRDELDEKSITKLIAAVTKELPKADAVVLGDYGKGVITQRIVDELSAECRAQGKWLSIDPKPVHALQLQGVSLLTPNRKEAFELAGISDGVRAANPIEDRALQQVAETLMAKLSPALLLITLGESGMLLCRRGDKPFHIPTVAQEVFDVSGAGDTVIASFTLAVAAGASPAEAAIFSNHAAGVVVGKLGTATVTQDELRESFRGDARH